MTVDQKIPPATSSRSISIMQKSFEKFAEIQKSAFDVYEKHAKITMDTAKQVLASTPSPFFELAEQGMGEFLKMQRRTLDLALGQSTAYLDLICANSLSVDGSELNRLMHDSAEYFFSMQKKAADFATQQTQRFADNMKREAGNTETPGSSAADAIRRGTEAVVQAQKGFWELMLKPFENIRIPAHG